MRRNRFPIQGVFGSVATTRFSREQKEGPFQRRPVVREKLPGRSLHLEAAPVHFESTKWVGLRLGRVLNKSVMVRQPGRCGWLYRLRSATRAGAVPTRRHAAGLRFRNTGRPRSQIGCRMLPPFGCLPGLFRTPRGIASPGCGFQHPSEKLLLLLSGLHQEQVRARVRSIKSTAC